jgi:hypothetical protein
MTMKYQTKNMITENENKLSREQYIKIIKMVRKPMPRPSHPISTKKGKKGYRRTIEKELSWIEVVEYLNALKGDKQQ